MEKVFSIFKEENCRLKNVTKIEITFEVYLKTSKQFRKRKKSRCNNVTFLTHNSPISTNKRILRKN